MNGLIILALCVYTIGWIIQLVIERRRHKAIQKSTQELIDELMQENNQLKIKLKRKPKF